MANPVQPGVAGATADASNQKASLLAGIAQNGSLGQSAYGQAGAALQNQQVAALQAIQQRNSAVQGGVPAAYQQQSQAAAAAPLDVAQQALHTQAAAYGSALGQIHGANSDYMDQLAQAIPLVQANTVLGQAKIQQQNDYEQSQRDLSLKLAQMQYNAASGSGNSPEADQGMGRNYAETMQNPQIPQSIKAKFGEIASSADSYGDAINQPDLYLKKTIVNANGATVPNPAYDPSLKPADVDLIHQMLNYYYQPYLESLSNGAGMVGATAHGSTSGTIPHGTATYSVRAGTSQRP